ncbi:MAG TPA: VOC family protein [Blastocatellia bacterium]|nr:VOC family protein [Blastocatellia bacterium]
MKKVTGIGGIFFKCEDPDKLRAWYQEHLGVTPEEYGGVHFNWREMENPDRVGLTVWSLFRASTNYFDPSTKPFMINYRVENLDALLEELRKEGVWIDEKREDGEFGRFAWVMDPEGNRIELWEPPKETLGVG